MYGVDSLTSAFPSWLLVIASLLLVFSWLGRVTRTKRSVRALSSSPSYTIFPGYEGFGVAYTLTQILSWRTRRKGAVALCSCMTLIIRVRAQGTAFLTFPRQDTSGKAPVLSSAITQHQRGCFASTSQQWGYGEQCPSTTGLQLCKRAAPTAPRCSWGTHAAAESATGLCWQA